MLLQAIYWKIRNQPKEFYRYSQPWKTYMELGEAKGDVILIMRQQIPQVEVDSFKQTNKQTNKQNHCMSQAQESRRKPEKNMSMAAEPEGSQDQSRRYQPWGSLPS